MIDDERVIKDFSENSYNKDQFLSLIEEYNSNGFDFYIGTDSQVFNKHISMVTAICPRKVNNDFGESSRVFYIKEKIERKECPNLRTRMLMEAYRSIEAAMDLEPYITRQISIHLDVGAGKKSETRIYQKELQFLVSSQGYDCKIKPESWASGGVADRLSKS